MRMPSRRARENRGRGRAIGGAGRGGRGVYAGQGGPGGGETRGGAEAQARRARRAGGPDPALSEYPLGLMLARRLVSAEQHEAGCHYAFLYGRTIGRTQVTCDRYYRQMIASQGGGFGPAGEAARGGRGA